MGMDVEAYLRYGFVIDKDEHARKLGEAFEEDDWGYLEHRIEVLGLEQLKIHMCGADAYLNTVVYTGKTFNAEWAQATYVPVKLPEISDEQQRELETLRADLGLDEVEIGWHLTALWF